MPAVLAPADVTDKIVRAITLLGEQGRLKHLIAGPDLPGLVRQEVERLPFALRSSYGGNTTCGEVQTTDALLILDCSLRDDDIDRELPPQCAEQAGLGEHLPVAGDELLPDHWTPPRGVRGS